MSRTKHHKKYGKNYSNIKYFIVPAGIWQNHKTLVFDKPKIKKHAFNPDNHWFKATPSWWTKVFMTKPKRAKCRNWEKQTLRLQNIEDFTICPDFGNKPHLYYW
jgi:hypothetical protein